MKVDRPETESAGDMAWRKFPHTEEPALGRGEASSSIVCESLCNDNLSSLSRAFLDPNTAPLSSTISGLGWDDWMKEDFIGSKTHVDWSISSIFGDIFPDQVEQELSSSSEFDVSPRRNTASAPKNGQMDLNMVDITNPLYGGSQDAQQSLLSSSMKFPESLATNVISAQAGVASSPISQLADLKNIIVKKSVLDKAVERLGGGRDGALKLWKLIQVWLKHQRPQSKPSCAVAGNLQEGCPITSAIQKMVKDLLPLPSDLDLNVQDGVASRLAELRNDPNVDSFGFFDASDTRDVPSLYSPQISPPVVEPYCRQVSTSQGSLLMEKDNQFASASTDLESFTNSICGNAGVPLISSEPDTSVVQSEIGTQDPYNPMEIGESEKQAGAKPHFRDSIQEASMQQQSLLRSRPFQAATFFPIVVDGVGGSTVVDSSTSTAASTRAARKNRMARKRRSLVQLPRRRRTTSFLHCPSMESNGAQLNSDFQSSNSPYARGKVGKWRDKNLKLPLEKELKPSGVSGLGRIILPEGASDIHLPNPTASESVPLSMEDMKSFQAWNLRYREQQDLNGESSGMVGCGRLWPKNKSQMYLLQNTAGFVKSHSLEEGESMMLFQDHKFGKNIIVWEEATQKDSSSLPTLDSPMTPCIPFSDKFTFRCSTKLAEGSPNGVGSSSSTDPLTSNSEEMGETIFLKNSSSSINEKVSSKICASIYDEFSQTLKSVQDNLVEEIIQGFGSELPVLEKFPSLDISDAAAEVHVDEMLELHRDLTVHAAISGHSSKQSPAQSRAVNQSVDP